MPAKKLINTIATTLSIVFSLCSAAHADNLENGLKIGYAKVKFNIKSGDLTGPPGTTPPGIGMSANDLDVLAISYERRFSANWSVQFQGGVPPTLTAVGAGAGQAVGTVATARIWFPTVVALYTFTNFPIIRPYVGIGTTYTFLTDQTASSSYTNAVGGTSSSFDMKPSWGPYARIGFEYPIDKNWSIDLNYSAYRLETSATVITQTPGLGAISRRIDIKDTPQIFGLTVGYKF